METLIPEIIPKKYEQLALEEITYPGAYIRCLTLMIAEGMIQKVLTSINCLSAGQAQQDQVIMQTLDSLEGCIVRLFELNRVLEKDSQSEMPYS